MAKILEIIKNPNEILRKKSLALDEKIIKSSEFQSFLDDMELTMIKKDGVGLAAPQIGKNIRVVVVSDGKNGTIFIINPIITKKSWAKEWGEEGCLSVPKFFAEVKRHKKIKCRFLDRNGKKREIEASDFMARVLQHEIDHLDGILFIDRIEKNRN